MGFTVQDFPDLIRLLAEHPEWRERLRRELLGEEIFGLPAAFARLTATVEQLAEEIRRLTERIDALTARMDAFEAAQERMQAALEVHSRRLDAIEATLETHTQRLDSIDATLETHTAMLTDHGQTLAEHTRILGEHTRILGEHTRILGEHGRRLGRLDGRALEQEYRERAASYFGRWLYRVRTLDSETLDATFGDSLDREQFLDLLNADLIVRGRLGRGDDRPEVWLAVEVSLVVDREDVERAARRSAILRAAGLKAIGVVGGEAITEGGEALARQEKVAIRLDGQVDGWSEALAAVGLST